jgi:integrase
MLSKGHLHFEDPIRRQGKYALVLSFGRDANGKRIQDWLSNTTDAEDPEQFQARVWAARLEGRYNRDDYRRRRTRRDPARREAAYPHRITGRSGEAMTRMTVAQAMDEWRASKVGQIGPGTEARYRQSVRRVSTCLGDIIATELTVRDVERCRRQLLETGGRHGHGRSAKTVLDDLLALRGALDRLKYIDGITSSPFDALPRDRRRGADRLFPRPKPYDFYVLHDDEIKAVVDTVNGTCLYEPVLIALDCGLRRAEAIGLVWDEVDLDSWPRITVSRQARAEGQGTRVTKTTNGIRSIPLTARVARKLRATRRRHAQVCPVSHHGRCRVLDASDIRAKNVVDAVGHRFSRVAQRLMLENVGFQTLRHTFATRQIMAGVNARTLAYWMGHADPGFTLRVYTRYFTQAAGLDQAKTKRPLLAV